MTEFNSKLLDRLRAKVKWAYGKDLEPFVAEALSVYLVHRPNDGYMWFVYGDVLRVLGRYSEAIDALNEAIELAPAKHHYLVCARMAYAHNGAGRREEAERWFAKSVENRNGVMPGWIWLLRGGNLAQLGRFEDAIACYRNALAVKSDESIDECEVCLNIGLAHRAQRRYDAAAESFHRAIALEGKKSRRARSALASLRELDDLPNWIGAQS